MTREEFFEEYTTWDSLFDICGDVGCDIMEDVMYCESVDDMINEYLQDWARDDHWTEVRDRLDDIPTGYDWYRYDGYDWCGLDEDDLNQYINEVADYLEEIGYFDTEEDEEEEEQEEQPEEDEDIVVEDEDCSIADMLNASIVYAETVLIRATAEEPPETDRVFDDPPDDDGIPLTDLYGYYPVTQICHIDG